MTKPIVTSATAARRCLPTSQSTILSVIHRSVDKQPDDSDPTIGEGHCPKCRGDRVSDIVASHEVPWSDDEHPLWGRNIYRVLRCRGCGSVYFQDEELFSENTGYRLDPETGDYVEYLVPRITHWPLPVPRPKPEWLWKIPDAQLRDLLHEIYEAFNADLHVLATIGTRTALDRAFVLKGAEETASFAHKIAALRDAGVISMEEEHLLNTCTDAGSAAAHRSWKPTVEMLTVLLDGVEAFLHRVFVLESALQTMKTLIPKKKTPKKPGS